MSHLLNVVRREATKISERRLSARSGTVSALDLDRYMARVILRPGGHETGWLPIGSMSIGDGWGIAAPPGLNDSVLVLFREGNLNSGVIGPRFFDAVNRPITGVEEGEIRLRHSSGSTIHFKANGDVEVSAAGKMNISSDDTIHLDAPSGVKIGGSVELVGDLAVSGNVTTGGSCG